MEISEAVLLAPENELKSEQIDDEHFATTNDDIAHLTSHLLNGHTDVALQKLEEKAQKAQEAFEKEEKMRKELEALNSKLLAEKTALLDSLSGEKGALQEYQEKTAKLTAQKNDCENQLRVSRLLTWCHPV